MHLVTVILGVLLFPKALSALNCYECISGGPGACTETQRDCPASLQCGAVTARTSVGGMDVDLKMKSCMRSAACGLIGSMNLGITRAKTVSTCCSTALCNDQYPSPPARSFLPNGKKCYTCNSKDCSSIVSCSGDEDRCVSTRVEYGGNKMTMKGCVSKSLCVLSSEELPGMSASMSCCEGDLCNSATSTAVRDIGLLPAPSYFNGKKCYTCNSKDCSSIVSCSGDEDRCVSTRVEYGGNKMTMKGCVSKSLCVLSSEELPGMSASMSCCEGDLCNSATSTAVSLLLLAAPLVSVALFN